MKEVIEKLSSYNIFNYLFPGIVFVSFLRLVTHWDFSQSDIIVGAFIYYFIGLIVSRFGSLVIEPIFKKIKLLIFTEYKKFINASVKDPKIEILSEVNNMYRTLTSVLVLVSLLKLYEYLELNIQWLEAKTPYLLIVFLLITFVFSYKKQTTYIVNRVNSIK
jgi:hypothetical protein